MVSEDGKDAAILEELKEISSSRSLYRNNEPKKRSRLAISNSSKKESSGNDSRANGDGDGDDSGEDNSFLRRTGENRDLNQYWYSKNTIDILCNAIREGLSISQGSRVAFLSTPSLFFSLTPKEREHCALFDVSS